MAIARKPVFIGSFILSMPLGIVGAFLFVALLSILLAILSPILLLGTAFLLLDFLSKKVEPKDTRPIISLFMLAMKSMAMIPTFLLLVPVIVIAALIIFPVMFFLLSFAFSVIISTEITNRLLGEDHQSKQAVQIEDWMHQPDVDAPRSDKEIPPEHFSPLFGPAENEDKIPHHKRPTQKRSPF